MITDSQVERFGALFSGATCAYGLYNNIAAERVDGKLLGSERRTIKAPLTIDHYARHLRGEEGIGVIPIREDDTAVFGAIDVDDYSGGLSVAEVGRCISSEGLPMIAVRSKSGGAHLYLFAETPIPARTMIDRLRQIAARLGFGGSEIFPKQGSVNWERGDLGSWINIPYFDGLKGLRYAVNSEDGEALELEEFLGAAYAVRCAARWFHQPLPQGENLSDGPPCLQRLVQIGLPPGGRNNGLFNIGVYLRKKSPDNWESELEEVNRKHLSPPLSSEEVMQVKKSLKRKDYGYRCADVPLNTHCDRSTCSTRRFGIGEAGDVMRIESLRWVKTDPPEYFPTIAGRTLSMDSTDIQFPLRVQNACIKKGFCPKVLPTQKEWAAHLGEVMKTAEILEVPEEVTPRGQLKAHLVEFLTGRSRAEVREEILLRKPYLTARNAEFRLVDFQDYLQRRSFRATMNEIYKLLKDVGGVSESTKLKGTPIRTWKVPRFFEEQAEPFPLPPALGNNPPVF